MASESENPLKDLHRDVFMEGQKTVAKGVAAEFLEEQAKFLGRAGQAANDVLDLAKQIEKDEDPHKQQLARLLKDGVIRSVVSMQQIASGEGPAGEGGTAAQATPFLNGSNTSAASLPATSAKALEDKTKDKPRRGRPPKPRTS